MVSGYDCSNRKRWWWRTNVPPLRAIYDGHADALEQYGVHRLIQHDQGFTRSHWMPLSGNYLLRIAHAATRVTINKTSMENVPTLLAILMAIPMQGYNTAHIAQWRRFVAFTLKATKRHHQAITCSVSSTLLGKRARVDMLAPNNNGGMTCQTDEKHITNFQENFVGAFKPASYS